MVLQVVAMHVSIWLQHNQPTAYLRTVVGIPQVTLAEQAGARIPAMPPAGATRHRRVLVLAGQPPVKVRLVHGEVQHLVLVAQVLGEAEAVEVVVVVVVAEGGEIQALLEVALVAELAVGTHQVPAEGAGVARLRIRAVGTSDTSR
jgi:hypothetical protein